MKVFRSFIGYFIACTVISANFGQLADLIGPFGGFLAAIILVGPMWFVCHYLNLVDNKPSAVFVDFGVAVGVCCIVRDTFINGNGALIDGLPTILLAIIGGALGGFASALVEKDMANDELDVPSIPEPGMTEYELNQLKVEEEAKL